MMHKNVLSPALLERLVNAIAPAIVPTTIRRTRKDVGGQLAAHLEGPRNRTITRGIGRGSRQVAVGVGVGQAVAARQRLS